MSLEKRIELLEMTMANIALQQRDAEDISEMARTGMNKSVYPLICQVKENPAWHISVVGNALFKETD